MPQSLFWYRGDEEMMIVSGTDQLESGQIPGHESCMDFQIKNIKTASLPGQDQIRTNLDKSQDRSA